MGEWITVTFCIIIIQWALRMQIFPVQVRYLKRKWTCFIKKPVRYSQVAEDSEDKAEIIYRILPYLLTKKQNVFITLGDSF